MLNIHLRLQHIRLASTCYCNTILDNLSNTSLFEKDNTNNKCKKPKPYGFTISIAVLEQIDYQNETRPITTSST